MRALPLLLCTFAAAACHRGAVAPINPQAEVAVNVDNQNFLDMNVFLVRGGQRIRLGTLSLCNTVSTSRAVSPPGSRCDTPGANAGSKASRSIETYTGSRRVGRRPSTQARMSITSTP